MVKHNALALIFLGGGVIANNYAYLHDVVTNRHDGVIYMGVNSYIGVAISLVAIALGLVLLLRGPRTR
jgi:hypothetical protein